MECGVKKGTRGVIKIKNFVISILIALIFYMKKKFIKFKEFLIKLDKN